jgi:AIPR protein
VNSRVAKQIRTSLLNEDTVENAFHLAHLGITVVATEFVKVDGREDAYRLKFKIDDTDDPQDGIVNGLHTLAVIEDVLASGFEISPEQYVSFTVITGIPDDDRAIIVPFIAKGRNTVLQVKDESIDNLMKRFVPLQAMVAPLPYADKIGWEESADTDYDVLDVLAVMTAQPDPLPERQWRHGRDHAPNHRGGPQARVLEALRARHTRVRKAGASAAGHAAPLRPHQVRRPGSL